jgi:hypothetical protein
MSSSNKFEDRQLPSWHRRGGCGIQKNGGEANLIIKAARCRACASLAPQTGAKRERDSAKHQVVSMPKCFVVCDHPVRFIKGGFAASFLMSLPPLLFEEGSCPPRPEKAGNGFQFSTVSKPVRRRLPTTAFSRGYYTLSPLRG